MMFSLHYGGPVTGDQRFSRPDLENKLIRFIEQGAGAKMFGLRRTGKSTLLRFAEEKMARQGYTVVPIDAQGMHSIDNLLFGVFNALSQSHKGFLSKIYSLVGCDPAIPALVKSGFELIGKGERNTNAERDITSYWPHFSRHIVMALKEEHPQLMLSIDELPFLVRNMIEGRPDNKNMAREVDQFLAALREWRNAGLKMIVAGSIGMAGLARKHGFNAEHLNDLTSMDIPELTETEALALIQAANAGKGNGKWTDGHTRALMLELGAFYPCFLVKSLIVLDHTDPPPPEAFPDIFSRDIRPELNDTFLRQFDRRFKLFQEAGPEFLSGLVRPILTDVLKNPDGLPEYDFQFDEPSNQIEIREALEILSEDGFICFSEDRDGRRTCRPASRLVTLWGRKTIL